MAEDEEGMSLWKRVIKTVKAYEHALTSHNHSTAPKKKAKVKEADKKEQKETWEVLIGKAEPKLKSAAEKIKVSEPPQMDKSTKRKLQKGEIRPEGKIDLHGMTQAEAHKALIAFIKRAVKAEKRTLLVITGKGKNMGGVIRKSLPAWLDDEQINSHIISITTAAIKDGGEGAFYIRLKNSTKTKRKL